MALTKVIGNGTGDLTQLQILNGSNVRAASSDADDLIVEGPVDCGISILSATTGRIYFGDAANDDAGSIRYVHSDDSMRFETNDVEAMRISSIGAVTKPLQPAFLVRASTTQNSIASGDVIAFGTEVFDQNADFSSNIFTAPVTGRYQLNVQLRMNNLDISAAYSRFYLKTSNRNYESIYDLDGLSSDPAYWTFSVVVLADMDANDTAFVEWNQSGGASQATTQTGEQSFSGYLVA
jgi:hypothetical protein